MSSLDPARDPWADPGAATEPGAPYAGPPATAPPAPGWGPAGYGVPGWPPPGYGPPGYPPPGYAPPGYGYPPSGGYLAPGGHPVPWPVAPRRPRPPGQVIASAVLAFVQAALVVIASLYVWFFASILEVASAQAPGAFDAEGLATEGTVLAVLQLLSAVLLVTAGVLALIRRDRGTWLLLVAAHAVQILLSAYWLVRLLSFADDLPGAEGDAVLATSTLFFAAGPVVGLGLLLATAAKGWFDRVARPSPAGPPPGAS